MRELEAADPGASAGQDDTLTLLFLCCHPSLTPISQVALTLRAVGGLTTTQIARAFLVSEANVAQRITRAKQKIRQSGQPFRMPRAGERRDRLRAVQHVLYLVFNEGYLASSGPDLQKVYPRTDTPPLTLDKIVISRASWLLSPEAAVG